MVSWVGIGAETKFLRFQSLTRAWSKFDQGVEKPFVVPKSNKDAIYVLCGESMVLFSLTNTC